MTTTATADIVVPIDPDREREVLSALGLRTEPPATLTYFDRMNELDALRRAVLALSAERDRATEEARGAVVATDRAQWSLTSFKGLVRNTAKEVAERQGWCRRGLNETLSDLGLEEYRMEFRVSVTITADFLVNDSDGTDTEWLAEEDVRTAINGIELSGVDGVSLERWELTTVEATDISEQ
jgi:hypothetical protein